MTKTQLQQAIGLSVIVGHLGIMLSILVYFAIDYLAFPEMTTSLALVSPMFAVYTTAVIKHFIAHQQRDLHRGPRMSFPFVFISFVFPILYMLLVFALVTMRAERRVFTSFDQFTAALGALEAAFGIYAGQTLGALFEVHQPPPSAPASDPATDTGRLGAKAGQKR